MQYNGYSMKEHSIINCSPGDQWPGKSFAKDLV